MATINCGHCGSHTTMCEICGYCECLSEHVTQVIKSTDSEGWACPDLRCHSNKLKTLIKYEEYKEMVEDSLEYDPIPITYS